MPGLYGDRPRYGMFAASPAWAGSAAVAGGRLLLASRPSGPPDPMSSVRPRYWRGSMAAPVNELGSREAGKLTPRIGLAGDFVIGAANAGPGLSLSVTLAGIVAATAYGSGPVILLCAVPMLIIANAYRRLNAWNANCGAAFTWVGRSITPYLGWLTGWLMIMANLIGNVAAVTVLAPSVLAVAGQNQNARWPNIIIDTAIGVVMIAIAVVGI